MESEQNKPPTAEEFQLPSAKSSSAEKGDKPAKEPELPSVSSPVQTTEANNIQNQTPASMEVHHPHHFTHKKKWPEYLLEFFMLFLAVFLGFVAESFRESLGDRAKEREYMHSMMTDLQKDISNMNQYIPVIAYEIQGHDSLENSLELPSGDAQYLRKLYYQNTAFTWADIQPRFTQSAFSELKSTGNIRLIENKALTDSVLLYERTIGGIEGQHEYVKEAISKTYFFATDIFDISCYKAYNDFLTTGNYSYNLTVPYEKVKQYLCEQPQLLTKDMTLLKKYSRLVNNEKDQMAAYLFRLRGAQQQATHLMQAIKEEYHF